MGTTDKNKQVPSANFTVAVVRKLFDLKIAPPAVKITYGGKATVKVAVQRKDYSGPIAFEFKNLPEDIKADKVTLPAGQNEIDLELNAANPAKESKGDVQVVGVNLEGGPQQRVAAGVNLQVQPGLFDLTVEPALLKMHNNSSGKVKVSAVRKGHDGDIKIELRNLPAGMKADKATIAKGENHAEIEIKAEASVKEGDKADVHARGAAGGKSIDSPRFTVSVISIGQPPAVVLKVDAQTIKITQGGTASVKVLAVRKSYLGPIAVELTNLPPEVKSSKATIAMGESSVVLTLTASPKAEHASKGDVCAVGLAIEAENCPYASAHLTLQISRK